MLIHPQFNPIAISLGPIQIYWYGLMYFFAFLAFIYLGKKQIALRPWLRIDTKILDDAFFYGALGVVIGGRLGYVIFYQPTYFFQNPTEIFAIWQGGMSFHGGFIGVLSSLFCVSKKYKISWWMLTDFVAPLVPLGLFFGRIGNFINQELWGRASDLPWAIIFPTVDSAPRHPSQIYEALLEGLLLFVILWFFSKTPRSAGKISAFFLVGYGLARFLVEFTREPDYFLGFVFLNLTMGQMLSLPMILIGFFLLKKIKP
ncbi:MAG: prolipoprotein diacylglyceryl transferase [Methylophilaceae bacterium]|nr:prolipoprotein diacylglyceryl transferase [Methylophilaceae bacterium]MBL6726272.1 prolipoprotein diacylglyceryl transferase [Methylophilaceae bacterium]MBL6728674.1 prolipoprotein diacylglyceryl transferase [Methylophilaceae bacterium]MBL6790730.1 prolipoprotein diacylglyceryl transferase [Methylophilaceae bacterium]